jgi:hypothetical protein
MVRREKVVVSRLCEKLWLRLCSYVGTSLGRGFPDELEPADDLENTKIY